MSLLVEIASAIRRAVLPRLGQHHGRTPEGRAVGGDTTFGIDVVAEDAGARVLEGAAASGPLAWYTEDRGLVVRGAATRVIVLDPIDGTRPAGAGLESACVSVAAAPYSSDATLGDVDEAVVMELRSGDIFTARRGGGVRIVSAGRTSGPSPSPHTRLEGAFWVYGLRGRPAMPSVVVLEELIDGSGVTGGTFDLGSAAFALTRVVNGQMDAYVDHGQRMIDEVPALRERFEAIGGGAVLNNSPYDVAAGLLICQEAGCPVTDAAGRPLDDRPLLGSDADAQVSTLAACTPELHGLLLDSLDRGMARLRGAFG